LGIDNLVKELRNTNNLPHAQLLKMVPHVDNMETANAAFKTTFDKRSNDTVSTVVYDTKALNKGIITTYKDMAEYVLIMAKRKKTAYYTDILDVINNGRQYFACIIARREGGKEDTPPNTDTPK